MERERRQYAKMVMVLASSLLKRTQKINLFEKEEFRQWTKDLMSLYKPTKMIKIMEGYDGFTFQRAQRKVTSCFLA